MDTPLSHQSDGPPGTKQRTGPATNCQNCQNRHPAIVTTRWLNERTGTGRSEYATRAPGASRPLSERAFTIKSTGRPSTSTAPGVDEGP